MGTVTTTTAATSIVSDKRSTRAGPEGRVGGGRAKLGDDHARVSLDARAAARASRS